MESTMSPIGSLSTGQTIVASNGPEVAGSTVPILVGSETFHVHEALLASSSTFFQSALKPEWRTDSTKPINLEDTLAWKFRKYNQWLYTKQVHLDDNEHYSCLAHLYVFGETIMDEVFQQAIVKTIISRIVARKRPPAIESIRILYAGTSNSSPARQLVADICAHYVQPKNGSIRALDPELDGEFMKDFCMAVVTCRKPPGNEENLPWVKRPESYMPGFRKESKVGATDEDATNTTEA